MYYICLLKNIKTEFMCIISTKSITINHKDVLLAMNKAIYSSVKFESLYLNDMYKARKYVSEETKKVLKNNFLANTYIEFSDIILFALGIEFRDFENDSLENIQRFVNNFKAIKPIFNNTKINDLFQKMINYYDENGVDKIFLLKYKYAIKILYMELDCDFYTK